MARLRKEDGHLYLYFWVKYNELTTSSLEIIVSKGSHPQMSLIQVSEIFCPDFYSNLYLIPEVNGGFDTIPFGND